MSLQYIIDGYNIIRHPSFSPPKKIKDVRFALIDFIRAKRLCGSAKNRITIVFDGNPNVSQIQQKPSDNIDIIFSREETADNRIKKIIERTPNPRNTVVVSDDKEIRFFIESCRAKSMAVQDFINPKKMPQATQDSALKPELNYSQIHQINQELAKIWLK